MNLKFLMNRTPLVIFLVFYLLSHFHWKFALALALGMWMHELGHAVAYELLGLGVKEVSYSVTYGSVTPINPPKTHAQNAAVGLAGPYGGFVFAVVLLGANSFWSAPWLLTASVLIAIINLMHCLPVALLDGGHAWEALISRLSSRWQNIMVVVGVGVSVAVIIWLQIWMIVILAAAIIIVQCIQVLTDWRKGRPLKSPFRDHDIVALEPPSRKGHVIVLAAIYASVIIGMFLVLDYAIHAPGFAWSSL